MLDRFLTHVLARLCDTPLTAVRGALLGAVAALGTAVVFAGLALGATVALVTGAVSIWIAGLPAPHRLRVLATARR
jgi:hypothetical protein